VLTSRIIGQLKKIYYNSILPIDKNKAIAIPIPAILSKLVTNSSKKLMKLLSPKIKNKHTKTTIKIDSNTINLFTFPQAHKESYRYEKIFIGEQHTNCCSIVNRLFTYLKRYFRALF